MFNPFSGYYDPSSECLKYSAQTTTFSVVSLAFSSFAVDPSSVVWLKPIASDGSIPIAAVVGFAATFFYLSFVLCYLEELATHFERDFSESLESIESIPALKINAEAPKIERDIVKAIHDHREKVHWFRFFIGTTRNLFAFIVPTLLIIAVFTFEFNNFLIFVNSLLKI
jgi:hypothetical protein